MHSCGGSAAEVEIAQKGVSREVLARVIVYGLDGSGYARDQVELTFSGDASGHVALDLDGGNRSAIDAMDGGLGHAVANTAERMRHRGLKPYVQFAFTDEIYADPARLSALRSELGLSASEAPSWRAGYEPKEVLRIRPGKDSGILANFYREFSK